MPNIFKFNQMHLSKTCKLNLTNKTRMTNISSLEKQKKIKQKILLKSFGKFSFQ